MLPLKGFDVAIATLAMVNRVQPIEVGWLLTGGAAGACTY